MQAWLPWALLLLVLAMLTEAVFAVRWTAGYFRGGVPIFKTRIDGIALADGIERALEAEMARGVSMPMLFRRLSHQDVAFREAWVGGILRYTPLMHGLIRATPESHAIEVVGYANLSVFLGFGVIVFAFLTSPELILPIVIAVIFVLGYLAQAMRYRKVATLLRALTNPHAAP